MPFDKTNTIKVIGMGKVISNPDEVTISISIITQAPKSEETLIKNTENTNKVISEIKKIEAENLKIETSGFNLSPLYDYSKKNEPARLYAYQATSSVRITTSEIEKAGNIISIATSNGANRINNVRFWLKEDTEKKLQNEALFTAGCNAFDKAKTIADSINTVLDKVCYIREKIDTPNFRFKPYFGDVVPPLARFGRDEDTGEKEPLSINMEEIEIHVQVEAVFYLK